MNYARKCIATAAIGSVLLALSACGGQDTAVDDAASSSPEAPPATADQATEGREIADASSGATEAPAADVTSGDSGPTPRTARISTDPATVTLEGGEPQLVEFFAYW
jgi:hypothetical protein